MIEKKVFYNNSALDFNLSDNIRERLLNGYDDIELTLKKSDLIDSYEHQNYNEESWRLMDNETKG